MSLSDSALCLTSRSSSCFRRTASRRIEQRWSACSPERRGFELAVRGIRALHGRARQWEGARTRALALGLRLGLRLVRLRRCLVREDRDLVLAGEQALELILVDRLALDQDRRDLVELVHVLAQHRQRELVRLLDHAPDLVVDLARNLLGVVRLGAVVAAEERLVVTTTEHARAELL